MTQGADEGSETTDREHKETLHDQVTGGQASSFRRYQRLVIGNDSLWYAVRFELTVLLFGSLPGALGLLLRKWSYPGILGSVGRGVIFGRNLSIRHGRKIHIGQDVVFDENVTLDAKGDENTGIRIGDGAMLSRNATLSCKNGDISLGDRCLIGINCLLHGAEGSGVRLGDDVLVGAFAYLVGSGPYDTEALDRTFKSQAVQPRGGVRVDDNVWIGAGTQLLDGVHVGCGAVIGGQSLVNRDVPAYTIVGGVPARTLRVRGQQGATTRPAS